MPGDVMEPTIQGTTNSVAELNAQIQQRQLTNSMLAALNTLNDNISRLSSSLAMVTAPVTRPMPIQGGMGLNLYTPQDQFWRARTVGLPGFIQKMTNFYIPMDYLTPTESMYRVQTISAYSNLFPMAMDLLGTMVGTALGGPIGGLIGGTLAATLTPQPLQRLYSRLGAPMSMIYRHPEMVGHKGATLTELVQTEQAIAELAGPLWGINRRRVEEITRQLAGTSLLRDVTTVDEYKTKMEKLLKNLRTVTGTLRTTYEDAIRFMDSLRRMGIREPGQYLVNMSYQWRQIGAELGINQTAYAQNVVANAVNLQGLGYGAEGAMAISNLPGFILTAIRRINPEFYRQEVEPRTEETLNTLQEMINQLLANPNQQTALLGLTAIREEGDRRVATLDEEALREFMAGRLTFTDLMQRGIENRTRYGIFSPQEAAGIIEQAFRENTGALAATLMQSIMTTPEFQAYRAVRPETLSTEEVLQSYLMERFGLGRGMSNIMAQMITTGAMAGPDQFEANQRRITKLAQYEQLSDEQIVGRLDRWSQFWSGLARPFVSMWHGIQRAYTEAVERPIRERQIMQRTYWEQLQREETAVVGAARQGSVQDIAALVQNAFVGAKRVDASTLQKNIDTLTKVWAVNPIYQLLRPEQIREVFGRWEAMGTEELTAQDIANAFNMALGRSLIATDRNRFERFLNQVERTIAKEGQVIIGGRAFSADEWRRLNEETRRQLLEVFAGEQAAKSQVSPEVAYQTLSELPEFRQLTPAGQKEALRDYMLEGAPKDFTTWFTDWLKKRGGLTEATVRVPEDIQKTVEQSLKILQNRIEQGEITPEQGQQLIENIRSMLEAGQFTQLFNTLLYNQLLPQQVARPAELQNLLNRAVNTIQTQQKQGKLDEKPASTLTEQLTEAFELGDYQRFFDLLKQTGIETPQEIVQSRVQVARSELERRLKAGAITQQEFENVNKELQQAVGKGEYARAYELMAKYGLLELPADAEMQAVQERFIQTEQNVEFTASTAFTEVQSFLTAQAPNRAAQLTDLFDMLMSENADQQTIAKMLQAQFDLSPEKATEYARYFTSLSREQLGYLYERQLLPQLKQSAFGEINELRRIPLVAVPERGAILVGKMYTLPIEEFAGTDLSRLTPQQVREQVARTLTTPRIARWREQLTQRFGADFVQMYEPVARATRQALISEQYEPVTVQVGNRQVTFTPADLQTERLRQWVEEISRPVAPGKTDIYDVILRDLGLGGREEAERRGFTKEMFVEYVTRGQIMNLLAGRPVDLFDSNGRINVQRVYDTVQKVIELAGQAGMTEYIAKLEDINKNATRIESATSPFGLDQKSARSLAERLWGTRVGFFGRNDFERARRAVMADSLNIAELEGGVWTEGSRRELARGALVGVMSWAAVDPAEAVNRLRQLLGTSYGQYIRQELGELAQRHNLRDIFTPTGDINWTVLSQYMRRFGTQISEYMQLSGGSPNIDFSRMNLNLTPEEIRKLTELATELQQAQQNIRVTLDSSSFDKAANSFISSLESRFNSFLTRLENILR